MESTTLTHARRLWDHLSRNREHQTCDALVVCCSYDLRVCDYACELLSRGVAPRLVLSGKTGNWTRHLWDVPEAHVFRERALANGVAPGKILVEDRSTHFGENIAFSRKLLPQARRVTFLTKPNSILRVRLTVPIQWPGITAFIDAPPLSFPQDASNAIGILGIIHEMVGDIDRIQKYPARGFQLPHALPDDVLASWRYLIAEGFRHHLLMDA